MGKKTLVKGFGAASIGISGLSVINNFENGNVEGTVSSVIDLGLSRSPIAQYYFGLKIVKYTFTGEYTMGNAGVESLEMSHDDYINGVNAQKAGDADLAKYYFDLANQQEKIAEHIANDLRDK